MRRLAILWIVGAVFATAALFVAWVIFPGRLELELNIYFLVLGAMALLAVTSRLREVTRAPARTPFDAHPRQGAAPRLRELERIERELSLGAASAFDLHFRLRPVLLEIAEQRLGRHGLRLDAEPRTRETLGEELWEVVRPDREPPANRHAPGPGLDRMRAIVESLERV